MQTVMQYREEFYDVCRSRVKDPRGFRGREKRKKRLSARKFLITMGDFNAQVGRLSDLDEGLQGVLGKHNLPARNANGSMLLDMATSCRMCIVNT